jgi:uncharacterized protein YggE
MGVARFSCVAAVLTVSVALLHPAAAQERPAATITVVGEGVVAVPPDSAVVSVGVVTQAARAADALAQNAKAMGDVIAAVKETGVEARDIETSRVALRPQYSNPVQGSREPPKLAGYEAANSLSIRVRAIDRLGQLLDKLVIAGANQIRGIELAVADPAPLRDKARVAAVEDATRRAGMLAEAAGVRIARLRSISEGVQDTPRPGLLRMSAETSARPAVPIEAGEYEVRGRVTAVFEVLPK